MIGDAFYDKYAHRPSTGREALGWFTVAMIVGFGGGAATGFLWMVSPWLGAPLGALCIWGYTYSIARFFLSG